MSKPFNSEELIQIKCAYLIDKYKKKLRKLKEYKNELKNSFEKKNKEYYTNKYLLNKEKEEFQKEYQKKQEEIERLLRNMEKKKEMYNSYFADIFCYQQQHYQCMYKIFKYLLLKKEELDEREKRLNASYKCEPTTHDIQNDLESLEVKFEEIGRESIVDTANEKIIGISNLGSLDINNIYKNITDQPFDEKTNFQLNEDIPLKNSMTEKENEGFSSLNMPYRNFRESIYEIYADISNNMKKIAEQTEYTKYFSGAFQIMQSEKQKEIETEEPMIEFDKLKKVENKQFIDLGKDDRNLMSNLKVDHSAEIEKGRKVTEATKINYSENVNSYQTEDIEIPHKTQGIETEKDIKEKKEKGGFKTEEQIGYATEEEFPAEIMTKETEVGKHEYEDVDTELKAKQRVGMMKQERKNKKKQKEADKEVNKETEKGIYKEVYKEADKEVDKETNIGIYTEVYKETDKEVDKETNIGIYKEVNKEADKEVDKETEKGIYKEVYKGADEEVDKETDKGIYNEMYNEVYKETDKEAEIEKKKKKEYNGIYTDIKGNYDQINESYRYDTGKEANVWPSLKENIFSRKIYSNELYFNDDDEQELNKMIRQVTATTGNFSNTREEEVEIRNMGFWDTYKLYNEQNGDLQNIGQAPTETNVEIQPGKEVNEAEVGKIENIKNRMEILEQQTVDVKEKNESENGYIKEKEELDEIIECNIEAHLSSYFSGNFDPDQRNEADDQEIVENKEETEEVNKQLKNEVEKDVRNAVANDVKNEVVNNVKNEVEIEVKGKMKSEVKNKLESKIENGIEDILKRETKIEVENIRKGELKNEAMNEPKNEVSYELKNDASNELEYERRNESENEETNENKEEKKKEKKNEIKDDTGNEAVEGNDDDITEDQQNVPYYLTSSMMKDENNNGKTKIQIEGNFLSSKYNKGIQHNNFKIRRNYSFSVNDSENTKNPTTMFSESFQNINNKKCANISVLNKTAADVGAEPENMYGFSNKDSIPIERINTFEEFIKESSGFMLDEEEEEEHIDEEEIINVKNENKPFKDFYSFEFIKTETFSSPFKSKHRENSEMKSIQALINSVSHHLNKR